MHFCTARTKVHLTVIARMEARTFLKTPALTTLLLGLSHGLGITELFVFCDEINVSVGLVETLTSRSRHFSLSRLE